MTPPRSPLPTEDEALLGALLEGELSAADEAVVLDRLQREPALLAHLEALAATVAATQRTLAVDDGATNALLAGLGDRVLAVVDPTGTPTTGDGAVALASLVSDGEASAAHAARLDHILETTPVVAGVDGAGIVDAVAATLATTLAVRAALDGARAEPPASLLSAGAEQVDALQASCARVAAGVARTERAWALSAAALDGALTGDERDELASLAGAADGDVVLDALRTQRDGRFVGELLSAAADSAAFVALAARAGQSALQVIAAEQAHSAATAARTTPASSALVHSSARAPSWWQGWAALARRALFPLAVGVAAVVAFVGVRGPSSSSPPTAALEQAFLDVVGPQLLDRDTTVAAVPVDLPLLADNAAVVEALDATASTQVFETPESHITVIWVADLGDDAAVQGQGT